MGFFLSPASAGIIKPLIFASTNLKNDSYKKGNYHYRNHLRRNHGKGTNGRHLDYMGRNRQMRRHRVHGDIRQRIHDARGAFRALWHLLPLERLLIERCAESRKGRLDWRRRKRFPAVHGFREVHIFAVQN